jgi:hypothetical protein
MIKGMPHMNFPRYIGRDGRDFMYLTLRSVLPGQPIVPHVSPAESGEGAWRVKDLPQHGFPYAIATTSVRPDPKQPTLRARVLKVDPKTVKLAATGASKPGSSGDQTVLTFADLPLKPEEDHKHPALWLSGGSFAIGASSPGPSASMLFVGQEPTAETLATATALVGVTDDDGMMVLVTSDVPAGFALRALLAQLGCAQAIVAPAALLPLIGGSLDLSGELSKAKATGGIVSLVRAQAPAAKQIFPDTPVVDPSVWQPLQNKRVRYFRRAVAPPTSAPSSSSSSAPNPR